MICRNCGTENTNDTIFCKHCGMDFRRQPVQVTQALVPMPTPTYPNVSQPVPGKAFSIVGLICGIASLVFFYCWTLTMDVAIAGLVFSIIARKKASNVGKSNGMAIAGIICSSIGMLVSTICFIVWLVSFITNASSSAYPMYGL